MADPITIAAMTAGSAALSAAGTISSANSAVAAAKSERAQLGQVAAEKMALATRDMMAKQRETNLLQSNLLANAGASGGGASDSTVLNLAAGINAKSQYEKGMIYGQARESANMDLFQGRVGVAGAKAARNSAYLDAAGTLLSGAASAAGTPGLNDAFSKYGGKHPIYG